MRLRLIAISTLLTAGLASAASASTINLLPLGDSITAQGYYIAPLENLLSGAGYTPNLLANEGHSGYIIDGSLPGAATGTRREHRGGQEPRLLEPRRRELREYVHLADDRHQRRRYRFRPRAGQVQSRMSNLLAEIHTEAPLAHVIVAEIVPNLGAGKDPAVQQFNSDIAGVVSGPNTSLVDMYHAFESYPGFQATPSLLMNDNLHPNQLGGNVMAQVWFQGIQSSQQTPEPASLVLGGLGVLGLLVAVRRRKA